MADLVIIGAIAFGAIAGWRKGFVLPLITLGGALFAIAALYAGPLNGIVPTGTAGLGLGAVALFERSQYLDSVHQSDEALLLRSGIATAQAGRHLHLHPVSLAVGLYDEDLGGIWSGVPQSVLGDAFAEVEGAYGFRIECPQGYPGILAASFPWWGSRSHRERMAEARHAAPFIAIVRDRVEGRITIDRDGEPEIDYACGELERRLLTRAMVERARIHVAAGARSVFTLHTPPLVYEGGPIEPYLDAIGARGVASNRVTLFSAHQMSSCRIGTSAADSVADPDGQVRGVHGLYVTDASALPNASGVNPMLTVMALARRTASRMVAAS